MTPALVAVQAVRALRYHNYYSIGAVQDRCVGSRRQPAGGRGCVCVCVCGGGGGGVIFPGSDQQSANVYPSAAQCGAAPSGGGNSFGNFARSAIVSRQV